ncbi:MAG TPA: COX15/CtaA family protein [Methylomirabilota bacterium]|jgi:cytochrome c oxidase assembly protein subunit 15|nr:COX15/CtaA family protein [Methylomirabilota bacterium]
MKATFHAGVHKFALFVVAWAVFLLCAGALVTSEDAALAVPDWPLSYGSITPPMVGGIAFEHSHRVIAAILGLFVVILSVVLWRKDDRPWVKWLGVAAVGGVILQGVLGGLTVLKLLHYWLPVMHACLAQIMFATLVSIAVVTSRWWVSDRPQYEDRASPAIHTVVMLNAGAIFLQIALGAAFRHKYSPVTPHVVWAMGVLLVASWTAIQLRKRFSNSPEISRIRALLHGIVGVQLLLGIGALWTRLRSVDDPQPLPPVIITTVVHTVFGAVLFAVSILVVLFCYRLVPRRREVVVVTTRDEVPA